VSKDKVLPFSAIIEVLKAAKKIKYNFRSVLKDESLQNKLIKICEKCEEFIFEKLKTQAELDMELESQKGKFFFNIIIHSIINLNIIAYNIIIINILILAFKIWKPLPIARYLLRQELSGVKSFNFIIQQEKFLAFNIIFLIIIEQIL